MIPDAKISEIRERTDIAEIVGEYVTLRRAGANMKGVCPFHADSDPSFNVNTARQIYHCFGCGASGDVIGFIRQIEGIEFVDAVRRLATKCGVTLPEKPLSPQARTRDQRARDATRHRRFILEEATTFFEKQLISETGAPAREMLRARQIDEETAKTYRLGYAPNSWSALIDHMRSNQVSTRDLEDVGLVLARRGGSGYYDRFRHRLMFPIVDASGQPIAFSGRVLPGDDSEQGAKYINSPETQDYTKGKVLFGLHQARVPLSKSGEAILVEGNFDVVSLACVGITNVVAPLGTALTPEHVTLLHRRVERVVVLFDGDNAGRTAAARAFPLLAKAGLASYTVQLPAGEDPDSLARQKGADHVAQLLSSRRGLLDQIIDDTVAASDGSVQDIARRVDKLKPFIEVLKNPMEADLYRRRIAEAFSIDPQSVFRVLRGGPGQLIDDHGRNRDNPLPGSVAERELVGLLMDCPELFDDALIDGTLSLVSTPIIQKLLDGFKFRKAKGDTSVAELVATAAEDPDSDWLTARAMVTLYNDREKAKKALAEIKQKLAHKPIRDQIKDLDQQIRIANSNGDDMGVLELSRKKANLQGLRD